MKTLSLVTLLMALAISAPRASTQRVAIRVWPTVALAPAMLSVRTTIEPSDDNRYLNIEVDSLAYHRSSEIPLDGRHAARVNVFDFRGVPSGSYEVRAILIGAGGPIAQSVQLVTVEPAAGSR